MSAPTRSPTVPVARPPRWDSRRRVEPANVADGEQVGGGEPSVRSVDKVNLAEALAMFSEHGAPQAIGELNGQHLRLAKLSGPSAWRHHEHEDALFLVLHGRLRMELRERTLELEPGELLLIPRGVEHRPVADAEAHVLLFEPTADTL
ncbi:cupin domain-containing protein [Myxococcus sp. K38C18041901]|uniref:cupin domain-containing protein n=1 Tax=Myxococcus guangdongensis TaxID=2906760 RepID=UPI0020A801DE|nr:cupin domain-containing protein [Myxococcus guangdongensis]MCP3063356.1 cupin domain-containing protein [Myxococcus guangdongensis]